MIKGKVDLKLKNIPYVRGSIQNKATRIAISKASVPVKEAVIASAPQGQGALKKSIRIKTRYYKKAMVWAAIVGPSSTFARVRKKPKKIRAKKANKTLKALKKKAQALKKAALKTAASAAQKTKTKFGRKVAGALKTLNKRKPAPKPPKKQKRKRAWKGGKVRPARYAHLIEWGSSKMAARRFLTKAMSRSRSKFASILQSALKTEIGGLLAR